MNYIVLEYQTTEDLDGEHTSTISNTYSDKTVALQKYHMILSAAAVSGLKYHGALLMDAFGNVEKVDHFPEYQPIDI